MAAYSTESISSDAPRAPSPTRENPQQPPESAPSDGEPDGGVVAAVGRAYAGDAAEELPLGGYAVITGLFVGSFTAFAVAAEHARVLPERTRVGDILLLGAATHKLTRILTRDRVTMPVRAPFTRYEGSDGAGQVRETPRGQGLQKAIGSLLTCQYCAGPWIATALTAGLVFAPRVARLASSIFAMATVSDFLHQAYAGSRRWSA